MNESSWKRYTKHLSRIGVGNWNMSEKDLKKISKTKNVTPMPVRLPRVSVVAKTKTKPKEPSDEVKLINEVKNQILDRETKTDQ